MRASEAPVGVNADDHCPTPSSMLHRDNAVQQQLLLATIARQRVSSLCCKEPRRPRAKTECASLWPDFLLAQGLVGMGVAENSCRPLAMGHPKMQATAGKTSAQDGPGTRCRSPN